uniref:non-specific protein-tyrosine kinase n=1 Tax=Suricata suricatta TaxID=37032 RepID=A0A673UU63_SURSU
MLSRGQPHPGPRYVGLWDFEARTDQELSFRAGDLLRVARHEEEWCWAVRLDEAGRALAEGYVPHSYLAEEETVESEPVGRPGCATLQDLEACWPAAPQPGRVLPQPVRAAGPPHRPEPVPWPPAHCALQEARAP